MSYRSSLIRLWLFGLLFLCLEASAQIKGVVLDSSDRSPISVVMVKAIRDGKTIDFATTNGSGAFLLRKAKAPITLSFKHLSYREKLVDLSSEGEGEYLLEPSSTQLEDVTVQATRVILKGDTTSFLLNQYASKKDVTVEDALKKLPGIDITKGGTISYLGKKIDKLKIDGKELLGNDYDIATRNLRHNAVTKVEIMERQQEIKALKGVVSDNKLIINLVLNKSTRGRLNGNVEIGGGGEKSGADYLGSSTLLHFLPSIQTVASGSYQNNFEGFVEEKRLMFNDVTSTSRVQPLLSSGIGSSVPLVSDQYFRHKRGAKAKLHNTFDIGENNGIRINASIEDFNYHHTYGNHITYLVPESTDIQISEDQILAQQGDREARIKLTYFKNKSSDYLHDQLTYVGHQMLGSGDFSSSGRFFTQSLNHTDHIINNQFSTILKWGNKVLNVRNNLTAELYPHMDLVVGSSSQKLREERLHGDLTLSYLHSFGHYWRLYFPLTYGVMSDVIHSSVDKIIGGFVHTLSWSPELTYRDRGIELSLSTPLKYQANSYHLAGQQPYNSGKWRLDSHVSMIYTINSAWHLDVNGGLNHTLGDITDFILDPIRLNYRTGYAGMGVLSENSSQNLYMTLQYRKPLREFLAKFTIRGTHYQRNMVTQDFPAQEINVMSKVLLPNEGYSISLRSYMSKNYRWLQTKISGTISALQNGATMLREGMNSQLTTQTLEGSLKVSIEPSEVIEANYTTRFSVNRVRYGTIQREGLITLRQWGNINWVPTTDWSGGIDAEYLIKEVGDNDYSHLLLVGLSGQYKSGQHVVKLKVNNLFNQKEYHFSLYDGANLYSSWYQLRGINALLSYRYYF